MKLLACVVLLVACGHPSGPATATPTPVSEDDPSCPVLVPGTSVGVEDTDKGAALVFVTTGDVDKVRTRAKYLAVAHTKREVGSAAPAGHEMSDMIATRSTADESDVDRGARVAFTATRDEDVAPLQQELRMHARHLAGGTCKMAM